MARSPSLPTRATRVIAGTLVATSLALATPAARAAEPLDALYTQSIGDHVSEVPSAAPQGQQGTPDKKPVPGSDLGSAAAQAAITAAITLLVQFGACIGFGVCVFAGL